MKACGDDAACRAAASTSSVGALLATKAEACASSAANRCSSSSYIVSTTMPRPGSSARSRRAASRPLPSGQVDVEDDDVGLEAHRGGDAAAQVAGLVDDLEVAVPLEGAAQAAVG